ncbi:MAG: hypothetical protein ACRDDH_06725 [Cetobacterium sp.]|uniref:hypothetical protein n=2 Tax=Cetobacterium sp. TaxID=2071632 RepID=UPI003EE7F4CF
MKKGVLYTCARTFKSREYAEDFLRGNLRFMPLNFYTKLENDSREDEYEGVSSFFQPHLSTFEIDGIKLNPDDLDGPILIRRNKDNIHVLCMSAFFCKDKTKIFDTEKEFLNYINKPCKSKLLTFGNVTVLITNIVEFFDRIDKSVEKKNLSYKRKLVTYIPLDEFHGNIEEPGFVKDLSYSNESEYRFALKGLPEKSFTLNIGDISDIAVIMNTDDIDKCYVKQEE